MIAHATRDTCRCGHPATDHAGRAGRGECLDDLCSCGGFLLAPSRLLCLPVRRCEGCGAALVFDGETPRVPHACPDERAS